MPQRKKTKHATDQAAMATKRRTRSHTAVTTGVQTAGGNAVTSHAPARRNLRGRLGGLKDMPNMPLDILIEIFSLMHPRDLLNLTRTTKGFRQFLTSRQSEPFWKAARRQVEGLPQCPPFLSEPAYANLVFFSHCHSCLKPNVRVVMWEFLLRYCPKCHVDLVADHVSGWPFIDCIERSTGLKNFINVHHSYPTRSSSYKEPHYHWPEIEQFRIKFNRGFPTKVARDEWVAQTIEDVKVRKKFASDMQWWVMRQEYNRFDELDKLRNARLEAVKQRLRDAGWGIDLDLMLSWEQFDFSNIKGVRTSQKLTDHAWATIRKHVVEYMGRARERRLVRERQQVLSSRFELVANVVTFCDSRRSLNKRRNADMDQLPTFADLAAQAGIVREFISAPVEAKPTRQSLIDIMKAYEKVVESWYDTRKAEIDGTVLKFVALTPDEVYPHSLAIATWDCRRCVWRGMRWIELLAHPCGRLYWSPDPGDAEQEYHRALLTSCHRLKLPRVWTLGAFMFNPLLDKTRAAILACGEDPDTVTFAQMEDCGVRLVCRSCINGTQSSGVFDWKAAAYHGCANDIADLGDESHVTVLERLDAEYACQTRELEAARAIPPITTYYGCTRCCSGRMTFEPIQDHCSREHNVPSLTLDTDYYVHKDRKPCLPEPIRICSPTLLVDPHIAVEVEEGRAFTSASLFQVS